MTRARRLLVVASAAAACSTVPPRPIPSPGVAVLPLSFQTNLATTRECEYRGTVETPEQAGTKGANVVIFFASRDAGTSWGPGRGKAVRCPEPVLERLRTAPSTGEQQ